jgi:hypothetical protein
MSLQIRRFAVVSLAALALTASAAATAAASASAGPAHTVSRPAADDFDGYSGGGRHERPLRFGPFEFPRSGTISGGFSWGVRD